jgi:death-on-curing protein
MRRSRCALDDADTEYTYLDVAEALVLHAEIKGLPLEAVSQEIRDMGLLDSALARPRNAAVFGGADLADQAAALLVGLAENQPFVDGNKRTALVVTITFLEVNGYMLTLDEDQLFDLMIDISAHLPEVEVADRLRNALHQVAEPEV